MTKIASNRARDARVTAALLELGWRSRMYGNAASWALAGLPAMKLLQDAKHSY